MGARQRRDEGGKLKAEWGMRISEGREGMRSESCLPAEALAKEGKLRIAGHRGAIDDLSAIALAVVRRGGRGWAIGEGTIGL